jgi:hypothetical protein
MSTQVGDLGKINPFFEDLKTYSEENKVEKSEKNDDMLGKTSNRVLDEKWNVKIQFSSKFFINTFAFLKQFGYNTVIGLNKKTITLFKVDPSTNVMSYIIISKNEVSEYINIDETDISGIAGNGETPEKPDTIIYVEMDILDDMVINEKYPVDLYFDTKEKNHMYIINGKSLEARRLNDPANGDKQLTLYPTFYEQKIQRWLKSDDIFPVHIRKESLKTVLSHLEKKKTKKDQKSKAEVKIVFTPSDIDFITEKETSHSSIQLYGDDISIRPKHDVTLYLNVDFVVMYKALNLENNVIMHAKENFPCILETKLGAGQIKHFYIISPIVRTGE